MQQYYDTNKEMYRLRDTIRVRKVIVSGDHADAAIEQIQSNIDNGAAMEDAALPYKDQVVVEDQVFDAATEHSDVLGYPLLLAAVQALKAGQWTDIVREDGTVQIAQVVERKPGGYQAFEEVKEAIRSHLAGNTYDQIVENRVSGAQVVLNREVYDRIGVREVSE